jgi:hypothetical protein
MTSRGLGVFLQPQEEFGPHPLEGALPGTPGAGLGCLPPMRRTDFPLAPQLGELGKKLLQALPPWVVAELPRSQRGEGRLALTDAVQQCQRFEPNRSARS